MERIDYKGHTIIVDYDEWAENPLDWATPEERGAWFVMSHKQYNLPNELDVDFDDFSSWNELAEKSSKLPYKFVRWYEHSGIAVSLQDNPDGQDWDAGIVGVIFGETTERIKQVFADWKCYIEGDIYAYSSEAGACSGYYGQAGYDQMIAEAKGEIDELVKTETQAKREIATARTLAKKHGYILAKQI